MSKLVQSSKSQVAIFMVLALMIIIGGVLYFFYQRVSVEQEIEIVQPEVAPIKSYVENCIKSAAEDGLERIGLTGGYISIPQNIGNNPMAYLATFPASGFRMPYWWHDSIDAIPPLEFINTQLREHIKSELKVCIGNFEPFEEKYKINPLKEPSVDVKFNENDVSVTLKYPLEILAKEGDFKASRENFAYTVPIRFKKVYELAKLIMERENKDYFLERRTIDLYSMGTEIPTTDIEVRCTSKTWQLSSIKEKLKELLRVNIPYIRIKGTDYNPSLYVPNPNGKSIYSETYFQHHYIWEIDKDAEKFKNMKVSFAYENWPMQIHARPSENGLLKSNAQKGTQMLKFFCLHIWHFTYDIEYPVMATVFDKEAKSNKPYQFSLAFKVSIDHNQPNRFSTGSTLFEAADEVTSEEYCNDVQNEVTIFTVNNATGEDIRHVNLTFVCGRFYCDIGQSDWLSFGAAAGIRKRLPYCVYGLVKGAKERFAESQDFIQTDANDKSYVIALNPIKEFHNYRVVKHMLSTPSVEEGLDPSEKASIIINGKNIGYETFAVYPKEANLPLALPEGKDAAYELSIYLVDNENIIGGYIGDWKISKEDLSNANEIVFHVVDQGPASEDERFLFISGLSSYSKLVPQPELK